MAEESNDIKNAIDEKEQADQAKEQEKEEQTFLYEGEYLTREQIDKKKRAEQKEIIQKFIAGEQEVFEKEYGYNEEGLHFKIRIQESNVMQEQKIQDKIARHWDGIQMHITRDHQMAIDMLYRIQICGVREDGEDSSFVNPNWLVPADMNKVNRRKLYLLMVIGADYSNWEERFLV